MFQALPSLLMLIKNTKDKDKNMFMSRDKNGHATTQKLHEFIFYTLSFLP